MKMEIGFMELPDNLIAKLNSDFRRVWFDEIKKHTRLSDLARKVGISSSFIYHLKNGRHNFRIKTLKKLCDKTDKTPREIEENILELVSNRGARAKPKLPITPSVELSRLIGHCFGDGNISFRKKQFDYVNNDKKLVESVKADVLRVFGANPISEIKNRDGTLKITFSTIVGELLGIAGAPIGKKVDSPLDVPFWIKKGKRKIKQNFLRSIFDDDGSVLISKSYPAKNVNLHLTRKKELQKPLIKFLETIKQLLAEFKIIAHDPYLARKYQKSNGTRCVMGIIISDYLSICHFAKQVGFRCTSKNRTLNLLLRRGVRYAKLDIWKDTEKIKKILFETSLSTAEVARKIGLGKKTTLKRLKKLEKLGEVVRAGRIAPNRSIIWNLAGGEKTNNA